MRRGTSWHLWLQTVREDLSEHFHFSFRRAEVGEMTSSGVPEHWAHPRVWVGGCVGGELQLVEGGTLTLF